MKNRPLKIIQIIPSLNKGGAERIVLDICNELSSHSNVLVRLITFRPDNAYTFLTENIDWKVIPSKNSFSISGKSISDVKKLQQDIDNFSPDIIHSHLFESEIILSSINYGSASRVVHFHDNMPQFKKLAFNTFSSKKTLTNYFERRKVINSYKHTNTSAISISADTKQYISKNLPKFIQKKHLINAINGKRFFSKVSSKKEFKIVMIGSLVEKKGQILALQAMALLKDEKIHLDILGDGVKKEELANYISENRLDATVHMQGNVDYPEHYLEQASLYLHTAIYEPFGLALIEGMAAGIPVICTDGKGNKDLIINGENGFMINTRVPQLIANKILLLKNNEELRLKMGESAQEFSKAFDIQPYTNKLLTHYRDLIS